MAEKWDYELQRYIEYELPKGASLFQADLDTIVECAECGKELTFGQCYTSRTIHSPLGFGYGVCEECYEKEFELEIKEIAAGSYSDCKWCKDEIGQYTENCRLYIDKGGSYE